jgi:transposase InsO family protein
MKQTMIDSEIPPEDESMHEALEEKQVEPLVEPAKADAPPIDSPAPMIDQGEDEEIFRNPFFPRKSNTKPFFNCVEDKEGWEVSTWVVEQQASVSIAALLKSMETNPKIANLYVIVNGILHLRADTSIPDAKHRIVVPECLRAFVIGQHHNLELHAHQGRKRTTKMICARYYWRNMCENIARWIRACSACSRRKTTRPMNSGLTDLTLATNSWETVGIDLLGPLPVTEEGYRWLLTIVDQFSRWPMAIPLRGKTTGEIARALHDHLVTQHGPPITILSDRGRELISKAMQYLCRSWGVRRVVTGGYNPTGNAFCERFHRYLNSAITTLKPGSSESPEWDRLVPAVLFSYRCSINDATGFSPYYMLHGKEPRLPEELLFNVCEEKLEFIADYVDTMQSNLKNAFLLARKQQYAAAIGNRERLPEKFRPNFKLGDKLYVWEVSSKDTTVLNSEATNLTRLPKKWTNPWSGPFDFIEWKSERTCMIDYYGKPTLYPANRLTIHTPWDSVNMDTNQWCLQNRKGEPSQKPKPSMKFSEKEPIEISSDTILKPGDLFVFPMEINEENLLPFGMGCVIEHESKGFIHFQWMSNFNQNQLAKFLPMWFQPSDKKAYYKMKPTSNSHPPYTGKDLGVFVKVEDLILISSETPFLEENILKTEALNFILQNELVKQALSDFEKKRKTPSA